MSTPLNPFSWITQEDESPNRLSEAFVRSGESAKQREQLLAELSAGWREASLKANADPYEVVNTAMKGKSAGREFLANFLIGLSNRDGTAKSVREQLLDREINKQKMAVDQRNSYLLRMQQLMGQESKENIAGAQIGAKVYSTDVQAAAKRYGVDASTAVQLNNAAQRQSQFEEKMALERDKFDENQTFNDWRRKHGDAEIELTRERIAAMQRRNDLLAREDGSYQAQSPQGKALQEIALIGNSGETRTMTQAKQLKTEMDYIAEMIDTAETPEEAAKWEDAGRSKVLSLTANGLAGQAQKDAFQYRLKTLDVLDTASSMLDKVGPGNVGFFKGKVENWLRRYNGSASNDDVTRLFRVLNGHFFEYRQEMSGAAFSDKESTAYESISPTTDKEFNVNQALMSELERESIRELMNQLQTLGPQALNLFIKDVNGDKRFIYKGREYRIPQ